MQTWSKIANVETVGAMVCYKRTMVKYEHIMTPYLLISRVFGYSGTFLVIIVISIVCTDFPSKCLFNIGIISKVLFQGVTIKTLFKQFKIEV